VDRGEGDDEYKFACKIGGGGERKSGMYTTGNATEQRSDKSSYCHRMTGNDGNLVTDFRWGGLGTYNTNYNAPLDAWWGDPVPSGSDKYRNFNDCIKSEGQRWAENVFGTAIVVSVRRIFDWF
jgi:hypothetical protein